MSTATTPNVSPNARFRNAPIYLALVIPVTVFAFWKSYFGIFGSLPETMTAVVHIHTGLMFLWLAMLAAQAWFVRSMRFRLHRWVGRSSFVVVPVIILSGLATTHAFFNKPIPVGETEGELRAMDVITLGQLVAFGLTWWLAIVYRRNTPVHVRFIVSTLFAIGNAVVFRVFLFWVPGFATNTAAITANGAVLILILLSLIAMDWRKGLRRSPYWVVTLMLGILHLGYFTFGRSETWLSFCRWFASLGA
ncbi:MAG: hypothetical protein ACYTG5_08770 [Planctomycetota bacterium]|jgi:hypothetical protein